MRDHSNKDRLHSKRRTPAHPPAQHQKMTTLGPPPRHVPGTIKLAVRFGHPVSGFGAWILSAFILIPLLIELKGALGGFGYAPGLPMMVRFFKLGFPIFCALLVAALIFIAFKASARDIRLLENGRLGYARLVKKVRFKIPDDFLFRMTFEYEVDGKKYKTWVDNPLRARRLEDDALEAILYDAKHPYHSVLVDGLPAYIGVDSTGGLRDRLPFVGPLYLLIPIGMSAAIAWIVIL